MPSLDDLIVSLGGKKKDDQVRYKEYVIETQSEGNKPLAFEEWYALQQKK